MADRTVRAVFEARISGAQKGMRDLASEADTTGRKVEDLQKDLKNLDGQKANPEVELEIAKVEANIKEIQARMDDLHAMEATPEVTADVERAKSELSAAQERLRDLDGYTAQATVTADTSSAESAADSLADTFADAGEDAGDSFGGAISGKLKGLVAGGAIAGAATAIGAFIADQINRGIQNELHVDMFAAGTGLSEEEAARYGEVAAAAYVANFGESIEANLETVRVGFEQGIIDFDSTDAEVEDLIARLSTVATIMKSDIPETARVAGQLIKTGLVGSSEEAFDVLLKGYQNGADASQDLIDTLIEYPTHFRDLGLSAEDSMGLLKQGLEGGAFNADKVADALKELTIRVKDLNDEDAGKALRELGFDHQAMADAFAAGGPVARDSLDRLLDALDKVEDPAERAALSVKLFGTQSEDMAGALNGLTLDPANDTLRKFGESAGTADEAVKTAASNTASSLEGIKRSVEAGRPSLDQFVAGLDPVAAALYAADEAAAEAAATNTELYDSLLDTYDATNNAADATNEYTDKETSLERAIRLSVEALGDQSEILETVLGQKRDMAGVVMAATEAEGEFHESLRQASESLETNGQTLDVSTEKGYANMEALHRVAEAGWDHIEALQAQDATEGELQATMQRTRDKFIENAIAMGMMPEEAEAYADSLGLIPGEVSTNVVLEDAEARAKLAWWQRQRVTVGVNFVSGSQSGSMGSPSMPYLRDRHDGGWLPGRADGGWVPGPSSATRDTMLWPMVLPGMAGGGYLSQPLNGREFVVNAASAASNAALLEAINGSRGPVPGGTSLTVNAPVTSVGSDAEAVASQILWSARAYARQGGVQ